MWRNVSWNSGDSNLPEGMHKHEPGAYFKTASVQLSSEPVIKSIDELPVQAELREEEEDEGGGEGDGAKVDEVTEEENEQTNWRALTKPSRATQRVAASQQRQQHQTTANKERHTCFKARQLSSCSKGQPMATRTGAPPSQSQGQHSQHAPQGFRSRLSSISGALQHPRLARRLFSGALATDHSSEQSLSTGPIRITTTSIDSPQHTVGDSSTEETASQPPSVFGATLELTRPATSSSTGRRLSQLFLPQLTNLPQDPYGLTTELVPPHLLGIYGQPPLVGAFGGAHRASWADISLLGRLTSMRPSLDSAFHGGGQMRHSFDARK